MTGIVNKDNTCSILITGGAGFLGEAIVKELIDSSTSIVPNEIRIFDTSEYKGIEDRRITFIRGDVRSYGSLLEASKDIDIIIHSAAIVDWGTHSGKEVYDVNFAGTENVIRVCQENAVKVLVYTSSLDAVFTGSPLINIDERQPYPEEHPNMYCKSKALSEKAVIDANSESLKTCVLRPSDVYGEGDPYHIDSLINMAKTGFYVRLGNGKSKCQHVYVGNMADAHIQVARSLLDNNKKVEGSIYFITDGPGHNFFSFFDQVVDQSGYKIWPRNLWLPRRIAFAIGSLSEFIAYLIRPIKHYNPKFSRFAVIYTCTDFTFSSDKAKQDFGYQPKYSFEDAMERTVAYYRKGNS
jgi:nucleoside-diphosphate-sugar epimerase